MTPAELVRTTRLAAGLSQAELARRVGTHQAAIARLEGRRTNPRIATLEATLRALGHRLELSATPVEADLDLDQLRAHLRLTPAERAELHDRSYANARSSVVSARRVE
jgi:transcriptional regulator with XRE-family HTH domain